MSLSIQSVLLSTENSKQQGRPGWGIRTSSELMFQTDWSKYEILLFLQTIMDHSSVVWMLTGEMIKLIRISNKNNKNL